jgi:hypothetical protein
VNEDWMTELEVRAGEELERRMERYARLRLDPTAAQAKRARSALMEAAWRERLAEPAPTATAPAPDGRARGASRGWSGRRLGLSFAAAALAGLMLGTTAFATSRAGGPLYAARVALEELTLPTDPQARLEAELALAQGRLAEVTESVAKDDPGAIAASLAAYLSALDDLDESTGGPADRALTAVELHLGVLEDLLTRVPVNARSGIENAIARSSVVIDRLDEAGTRPTGGGNPNGDGDGDANGGAATGANPAGGSGAGGGDNGPGGKPAAATAKPTREPPVKPTRSTKPAVDERPARTPAPRATTAPGPDSTGGRP